MFRTCLTLLACAAALGAADGHRRQAKLGTVIGRQVVDAGHILEVRNLGDGQYLVRWGDLDNVIPAHAGKGSAFAWDGSVACQGGSLAFVRTVAFEDGGRSGRHADRIVADGYGGEVAWKARTCPAWDGVVVRATGHGALAVHAGSADLQVDIP